MFHDAKKGTSPTGAARGLVRSAKETGRGAGSKAHKKTIGSQVCYIMIAFVADVSLFLPTRLLYGWHLYC